MAAQGPIFWGGGGGGTSFPLYVHVSIEVYGVDCFFSILVFDLGKVDIEGDFDELF